MKTDGEQIKRQTHLDPAILYLLCAYHLRKSLGVLYGAHKDE